MMQPNSTKLSSNKFRAGAILTLWLLSANVAARGQSPPQLQQVLDRLDRLEKDNQALLEEVHALRQEVSALKPSAGQSASAPADSAAQSAEDRQQVQQNRIDELAQTKVEASQKFPIRITGMALFNASLNGRYNGDMENPLVASWSRAD